jgi:hypothetical protein
MSKRVYLISILLAIGLCNLPELSQSFAQAPLSFRGVLRRDIRVGDSPQVAMSIVLGDFNGDSISDLAVAKSRFLQLGHVFVLLGGADDNFVTIGEIEIAGDPQAIMTGDFNGDAIPDLAVASRTNPGQPGRVFILSGKGDGSFDPAGSFEVVTEPSSIAVGDFNGDTLPDLAVAGGQYDQTGYVSILMGKGDGSFGPAESFGVGIQPRGIVAVDFNGDAILDLAVANSGSRSILILLGDGNGGFVLAQEAPVGSGPWSAAAADFDGDQVPDLAVANQRSNDVSILLGNGDGTFRPMEDVPVGTAPLSIIAGDFNDDQIQDLAVVNVNSEDVYILLGEGDGTFRSAGVFEASFLPRAAVTGDLNGDTIPDLAVINWGFDVGSTVSIFKGNGDGTFGSDEGFNVEGAPRFVIASDFNGDEIADLAVVTTQSHSLVTLFGKGDGTFHLAEKFELEDAPQFVSAGDLNGDAILDLVVANANSATVSILLGKGDGLFGQALTVGVRENPNSIAIGDLNGDMVPDLVVATGSALQGTSYASILFGKGDGTFEPSRDLAFNDGSPKLVALEDFNGDKVNDLVVVVNGYFRGGAQEDVVLSPPPMVNRIFLLLGNGDGTFRPPATIGQLVNFKANALTVADINGDGLLDLAIASDFDMFIFIGNGNGTFRAMPRVSAGKVPSSIKIDDLNGDKIPDLVLANTRSNSVSILLGNGDGTFVSEQEFGVHRKPSSIIVADFDGDGRPDVAVANAGSHRVSIMLNETPQAGSLRSVP